MYLFQWLFPLFLSQNIHFTALCTFFHIFFSSFITDYHSVLRNMHSLLIVVKQPGTITKMQPRIQMQCPSSCNCTLFRVQQMQRGFPSCKTYSIFTGAAMTLMRNTQYKQQMSDEVCHFSASAISFSLVIVTITLCQHERHPESKRLFCWYRDTAVVPWEYGGHAKLLICLPHVCLFLILGVPTQP